MTTPLNLDQLRNWQRRVREHFDKSKCDANVWLRLVGNAVVHSGVKIKDVLNIKTLSEQFEILSRPSRRFSASFGGSESERHLHRAVG